LISTEDKNDMCDLDHVTPLISGLTRIDGWNENPD
jgi:hypothetical protein